LHGGNMALAYQRLTLNDDWQDHDYIDWHVEVLAQYLPDGDAGFAEPFWMMVFDRTGRMCSNRPLAEEHH
jgi:hypothetical protein